MWNFILKIRNRFLSYAPQKRADSTKENFVSNEHVIWEVTLVNVSHNTTFGTQVEGYKLSKTFRMIPFCKVGRGGGRGLQTISGNYKKSRNLDWSRLITKIGLHTTTNIPWKGAPCMIKFSIQALPTIRLREDLIIRTCTNGKLSTRLKTLSQSKEFILPIWLIGYVLTLKRIAKGQSLHCIKMKIKTSYGWVVPSSGQTGVSFRLQSYVWWWWSMQHVSPLWNKIIFFYFGDE